MFAQFLHRWNLEPDGEPIVTHSSRLLPVTQQGVPAMLKIAIEPEESYGAWLMDWWEGDGAARVLEHEGDALLLERATGTRSLTVMAHRSAEEDIAACRILCQVVSRLHRPRQSESRPAPDAIPLDRWFRDLEPAAAQYGGILPLCASTARHLLASPQDTVLLHGDIHHGNILDFGTRGWLAIDPKRLTGERGFDYANLFSNPTSPVALSPNRLAQRAQVVATEAQMNPERLLMWIVAQSGLSAAWTLEVGGDPTTALQIAMSAVDELHSYRSSSRF